MKVLKPTSIENNEKYEKGQLEDMEIENRLEALRSFPVNKTTGSKPKPIVRVMSISKRDEGK